MTAEELLERYATGERDFSGVDLRRVNLMEVDLGGLIWRELFCGELNSTVPS
jgi:hypothetical protein